MSVFLAKRGKTQALIDSARAVLGTAFDDVPELATWVNNSVRRHVRDLERLREAVRIGDGVRKWRDHILRSEDSRVACVLRALAKRRIEADQIEVLTIARAIRPWRDCGEPVHAVPKHKRDGSVRWTIKYGPKRLALSYLVVDLLDAMWGRNASDWNCVGRGAEAAVRVFRMAIEHDRPWTFSGDVRNFFPSIRHDGLKANLPLPENVIDHSVLIGMAVEIVMPSDLSLSEVSATLKLIRTGLPQGSPASNFIASHLTRAVLDEVSSAQAVSVYTDNVFGACATKAEAEATLKTLFAGFAAHPLGPFQLQDQKVIHSDTGIEVLGYLVKTHADADQWKTSAFPTGKTFDQFRRRLRKKLLEVDLSELDDFAIERGRQWAASRSLWNPSGTRIDKFHRRNLQIAAEVRAIRLAG